MSIQSLLSFSPVLLILLLILISSTPNPNQTFSFPKTKTLYFKNIYINQKGKLIAEYPFQKYLGRYLHSVSHQNIFKARSLNQKIVEYSHQKKSYYVIYSKNLRVRELGEKLPQSEISYIYRYHQNGLVQKIDSFFVQDHKPAFKYFKHQTIQFTYNSQNQLTHKKIFDKNQKLIQYHLFSYQNHKLSSKKSFANQKLLSLTQYTYKNSKLASSKTFQNNSLVQSTTYSYFPNHQIQSIKPTTYQVQFYPSLKKNTLQILPINNGIPKNSIQFNPQGYIISVQGILPNVQSYIQYLFKIRKSPTLNPPQNKKQKNITPKTSKQEIYCIFKNRSKNQTILNTIFLSLTPQGHEINLQWFNQNGVELFQYIPKIIRYNQLFSISNLLNTKYLIFGQVLTEKKMKITNEIIVEIYDQNNQRNWCYFSNGFYYYISFFHQPSQNFHQIQILKSGFQYQTIHFKLNKNQTIYDLPTVFLKTSQPPKQ